MGVRSISFLLISVLFLSACNGPNPKKHLDEIYMAALDDIMDKDKALNSNMTFIAIDMSDFTDLNKEDKREILQFFKDKYKVKTMNADLDDLKEKGYYNPDSLGIDGVLLKIEKLDIKFNWNVSFEGSKFKSGKGAIGVEGKVHYKDGIWKIKESEMTWMS